MVEQIQKEIELMKAKREEIASRLEKAEAQPPKRIKQEYESPIHEALSKVDLEDVGDAFERTMKRNRIMLDPISVHSVN